MPGASTPYTARAATRFPKEAPEVKRVPSESPRPEGSQRPEGSPRPEGREEASPLAGEGTPKPPGRKRQRTYATLKFPKYVINYDVDWYDC